MWLNYGDFNSFILGFSWYYEMAQQLVLLYKKLLGRVIKPWIESVSNGSQYLSLNPEKRIEQAWLLELSPFPESYTCLTIETSLYNHLPYLRLPFWFWSVCLIREKKHTKFLMFLLRGTNTLNLLSKPFACIKWLSFVFAVMNSSLHITYVLYRRSSYAILLIECLEILSSLVGISWLSGVLINNFLNQWGRWLTSLTTTPHTY